MNTDEPAFPRDHRYDGHNGMNLRDYFAAKAMQGALTGAKLPGLLDGDPDIISAVDKMAAAMYRIADAMVAAR